MQPHILFILKPLTRAILRKEADTWKRTIRVISHEINNSLAPISSLIHSGRLMLQKPEMVPRLAEALDTIEERSTHLRGFIEGYAKFARLPAARQAGEPLGSADRRAAPALLVPGRGQAARRDRGCSTRARCSRS